MEAPDHPPAEPLGLLRRWLGEATTPGGDPPAAVLATVGRFHRRLHYRREDEGWSHWLLQP